MSYNIDAMENTIERGKEQATELISRLNRDGWTALNLSSSGTDAQTILFCLMLVANLREGIDQAREKLEASPPAKFHTLETKLGPEEHLGPAEDCSNPVCEVVRLRPKNQHTHKNGEWCHVNCPGNKERNNRQMNQVFVERGN